MKDIDINDHYLHLKKILQLEKEEDLLFYKNQLKTLSIKQKVGLGYLWHPVTVTSSGFTTGGKIFIQLERKIASNNNQLQPGKPVIFASEASSDTKSEIKATIYSVSKTTMKIVSNSRDLPEWLNKPPLSVEIDFDERSYKVMEFALNEVLNSKSERIKEFKSIFQGIQPAKFLQNKTCFHSNLLNESQNAAANNVLTCQDIGIIHGPPGTGKTTTLVQIIKFTLETEKQILVTAPSNVAVDLLVEKLVEQNLNVIRIGNISRIDESLVAHTLDAKVEAHKEYPNIKKIKIEAASVRIEAGKYKRHFTQTHREERTRLKNEAKGLESWARDLENRITSEIIDHCQIIATTLTSSANEELRGRNYSTVFLDEASQAMEPASWIAFLKADRIIMAGDPLQLPPTVKSIEAQRQGLNISLLEHCINIGFSSNILTTQYRMQNEIMSFSNEYFYEGKLQTAISVENHKLENIKPVMFIDTAGAGFEEQEDGELSKEYFLSKYNEGEYFILREHLLKLMQESIDLTNKSIVILTPYRAQVRYIKEQILQDEQLNSLHIRTSSIDGFQGQESDIVIISLVRSNTKCEIGFLTDYRRMNVAMTRAKAHLAIIGDSSTLAKDAFYGQLIDFVMQNEFYHSAYEYMY